MIEYEEAVVILSYLGIGGCLLLTYIMLGCFVFVVLEFVRRLELASKYEKIRDEAITTFSRSRSYSSNATINALDVSDKRYSDDFKLHLRSKYSFDPTIPDSAQKAWIIIVWPAFFVYFLVTGAWKIISIGVKKCYSDFFDNVLNKMTQKYVKRNKEIF